MGAGRIVLLTFLAQGLACAGSSAISTTPPASRLAVPRTVEQVAAGPSEFVCNGPGSDSCWMESLADDPLDQARAWTLLGRAAKVPWNEAPIANSLKIWLDGDHPHCSADHLAKLVIACSAGLAPACRDLYLRKGCMREVLSSWTGSKGSPLWAPGSFAFLAKDVTLGDAPHTFGTVRRGTKVVVLGRRDHVVAILVLEGRLFHDEAVDPRFVLGVPAESLSIEPVESSPSLPEALVVRSYARHVFDGIRLPSATDADSEPEDFSWIATGCDPIAILEERTVEGHALQRIRQVQDGVALEGWINEPILRSWGPAACTSRAIRTTDGTEPEDSRIPGGYELVDQEATKATLRGWLRGVGTVTMLHFDEVKGPSCETHDFRRGVVRSAWGDWVETTNSKGEVERQRWRAVESMAADGTSLVVHPTSESHDGRIARFRCYDVWDVVRVSEDAIEVMHSSADKARLRVYAYHPDDVTRWWRNPEACERALAERPNYSLAELKQRATNREHVASIRFGVPGC